MSNKGGNLNKCKIVKYREEELWGIYMPMLRMIEVIGKINVKIVACQ